MYPKTTIVLLLIWNVFLLKVMRYSHLYFIVILNFMEDSFINYHSQTVINSNIFISWLMSASSVRNLMTYFQVELYLKFKMTILSLHQLDLSYFGQILTFIDQALHKLARSNSNAYLSWFFYSWSRNCMLHHSIPIHASDTQRYHFEAHVQLYKQSSVQNKSGTRMNAISDEIDIIVATVLSTFRIMTCR